MKVTEEMLEADRNWGEVELFRHQYGALPLAGDARQLLYSDALIKAAVAVRNGLVSPFNAGEMLKVAGLKFKDLGL